MSFEDEMRLHYLTVSYRESWDCINDGVRWWLTACAPVFYEKHQEIAYKSWKKVNTLTSPWSRVGAGQTLNIGCNVVLRYSFPEKPRHTLRNVLMRVAEDPANKGHEALKRLREQSFSPELEDCFLWCISALHNERAYAPDALYSAIYNAVWTLPDEKRVRAMAEIITCVLHEDGVYVSGL